jgi:multidrug efflux pump subunit AcrA (membrane-fusion protein)
VTAGPIEPPVVSATRLEADIAAVLAAHGLADLNSVQVTARFIVQGDQYAGVTVTATAFTRPTTGPSVRTTEDEAVRDEFNAIVDRLKEAS